MSSFESLSLKYISYNHEMSRQPHRVPDKPSMDNQYSSIDSPCSPATIAHAGMPTTVLQPVPTPATSHPLPASGLSSVDFFLERARTDPQVCEGGEVLRFTVMHQKVMEWCSLWGGYKVWSYGLVARYHDALNNAVEKHFIRQVRQHAQRGRHLIQALQDLEGDLPADHCEVKELWVLYTQLLEILFEGTMVLELRSNFFPNDYTNFRTLRELHRLYRELGLHEPSDQDSLDTESCASAISSVMEQDYLAGGDRDAVGELASVPGNCFSGRNHNNRDDRTQFIYMWRRNIHLLS